MPDILEVVAKINVEAGSNAPLEAQINAVKKQAEAIDELARKRDLLNKFVDKDKNAERAARAKIEIDKLTKAIDTQTAALTKQVQQQNLISRAAQNELGIIQKLQDKLSDLTQARERQKTVGGIQQINDEIRKLNAELQNLTNTADKGLLSQLFGIGSATGAGKQVLQGALAGLGIGVGFSVIPALTSSLVELVKLEVSATGKTKEYIEANDKLAASFKSLGDAVIEYEQQQRKIDILQKNTFAQTAEGAKRAEELAKAQGVVNRDVFGAQVRDLQAAQDRRNAELDDIKRLENAYKSFGGTIKELRLIGGVTEESVLNRFLPDRQRRQIAADINKEIDRASIPEQEKEKIRVAVRDAADGRVQFYKVLERIDREYTAKLSDETQNRLSKVSEIEAAAAAFASQKRQERDQLELALKNKNFDEQIQIQQAALSRQEATTELINKQFDLRGRALTEALNREREETILNGNLTAEIQKEYDKQFQNIQSKNEAERLEALRVFGIAQLRQQEAINELLLRNEITSLNQQVQLLTGIDLQKRIDARNELYDAEAEAQRAANSKQFTEQTQALEKQQRELEAAGKTESAIYKQNKQNILDLQESFSQRERNIDAQTNRNRVASIQQGYADVIAVINRESQQLQGKINLADSERNLAISERGGGGIFGRGFQSKVSGLRTRRDTAGNTLSTATAELGKAQAALGAIRANVNATQEAVSAAEAEVVRLETVINNANAEINTTTRQINNEFVNAYADAFKSILEVAQQGYNTLQEYRIQDLDREISVREQRVSSAIELAKLGNTALLDEENKRLRAAQQARRKEALEQQAINSALQLSYALLAVARAAADPVGGGIFAPATIAAALGALFSGYALVRTSQRASENTGFAEGGYTGDGGKYQYAGPVHRGEFVMTAANTRKHRPLFEAIHRTGEVPVNYGIGAAPTRSEFDGMTAAIMEVRDAVANQQFKAVNKLDANGATQLIERTQRKERLKWKN